MKRYILLLEVLIGSILPVDAKCHGKFVNPLTDICWECLFPITVASANVTPSYSDPQGYSKLICSCAGIPPKVGIPISFWEPNMMMDVTRSAYCLMGVGGISIRNETIYNRGTVGRTDETGTQNSFYHVHVYNYPVIAWLELLTDFPCVDSGGVDIGYMTELDPTWNDEEWGAVLNAEAALFSSQLAQASCIADCVASSAGRPLNSLFWCAGCEGSLYPFSGNVAHHTGGLQAGALLMQRMIAKLHRQLSLKGFDEEEFCDAQIQPFIQKINYKHQLVYPAAISSCHYLGSSDMKWGMSRTRPISGEDFTFIIWRKKHCCLDALKPAMQAVGGM